MKTNASNIMLRNLKCEHNLFDRIYFGINGGFFSWTKNGNRYRVLNLAKCDGAVVGPNSDDGISNGWLGGGVIYWDGKYLKCLTGEPTIEASEIPGTKDTGTWAQGGYSMWLGDKKAKERSLEEVNNDDQYGYLSNSAKGRTALVADLTYKKVYLIVTPSLRTCIHKRLSRVLKCEIMTISSLNKSIHKHNKLNGLSTLHKTPLPLKNGAVFLYGFWSP